jgi:hypothetical protein
MLAEAVPAGSNGEGFGSYSYLSKFPAVLKLSRIALGLLPECGSLRGPTRLFNLWQVAGFAQRKGVG